MKDKQQIWIEKWHITRLKSVFPWTQSRELLTAELYKNLQRAVSPSEKYFLGNRNLFERNNPSHNREIYDLFLSYVEVNPEQLPERFIELFELKGDKEEIKKQTLSLFKQARLLDKKSSRISFIDDKIVIFRTEEKLTHKNSERKLTRAEKNRTEYQTTFNTYSNIYDAVRSQYHTLDSSEKKKDEYKILQQECLKLAQEIQVLGYETKDTTFQTRIWDMIEEISNATNAKVLASNLQNLQEMTYSNRSIDANHLQWAKNKFEKRFADLQAQIGVIQLHLNSLEQLLTQHETALKMFLLQIRMGKGSALALENYLKAFKTIPYAYQDIAPFSTFHAWIQKYHKSQKLFPLFVDKIEAIYAQYQEEHTQKLAGSTSDFEDFKLVKDNLKDIEELIISQDEN